MTYIQPLLLLFLAIGALGWWRSRRRGAASPLVAAGLGGLFLISWSPAAWLASLPFEARYLPAALPAGEAQAIVVLAAGVLLPAPGRREAHARQDTYERTLHAAWLYRHWRPLPVLTCGGPVHGDGTTYASVMRHVLEGEGVPEADIWTEERSETTYENALYGARILHARGISRVVLVTDATHMVRAERCFRKQGLTVLPAPCAFYTPSWTWSDLVPGANAIRHNENTLHELIGLIWYKLRGWI